MIERVDLGLCPAYDYAGNGPTAVVLPGAMLGGKSLGVYGLARDETPAVALTPALTDPELAEALRTRGGPLLLVGGDAHPLWDGHVARALTCDVLELAGADHGLARTADGARAGEAVERFSVRRLGGGA